VSLQPEKAMKKKKGLKDVTEFGRDGIKKLNLKRNLRVLGDIPSWVRHLGTIDMEERFNEKR